MNKQTWIEIKQTNQIPIELFYEYYQVYRVEESEMSLQEFRNNFQMYVFQTQTVPIKKLIEYYDQKFNIIKLFDTFGKLIKEY